MHVNIEKFITYDVLRYIFGDSAHMTSNDNIKFIYNTSSGRLAPFFRIENHIEKIVTNSLTNSPEQHVNIGMFTSNHLLTTLTKDNIYRAARNRAIYKTLQRQEEILKLYDDLMDEQLGVLLNDTTNELPSRYFSFQAEKARKDLIHNFEVLKKYLDYSRVFIEFVKKTDSEYELLIKPDSNSPIGSDYFNILVDSQYIGQIVEVIDAVTGKITKISVTSDIAGNGLIDLSEVFSDLTFSLSLDDELEPLKNEYKFLLKFKGSILAVNATFINDISGQEILLRDSYSAIVDESVMLKPSVPNMFDELDSENLIIRTGYYKLNSDLVLPYGRNLIIEKGVTIELSEGVSILVSGNLYINGSDTDNVKIIAEPNGKPFGSFSAVGNGETICEVNYLDISGGSEDVVNGVYLSGALSIYNHSKVAIKNSKIHDNHADDGLNIKNSELLVENNIFYANKADQVDIDSGQGVILNNQFSQKPLDGTIKEAESDSNGDGLDLSDSRVTVSGNNIEGFLDKGFSIGENTQAILINNIFLKNRSAVTIKDQSRVYLKDNQYFDNELDLEMYQKKLFFDPPSLFRFDNSDYKPKILKTKASRYFKSKTPQDFSSKAIDLNLFNDVNLVEWVEYE